MDAIEIRMMRSDFAYDREVLPADWDGDKFLKTGTRLTVRKRPANAVYQGSPPMTRVELTNGVFFTDPAVVKLVEKHSEIVQPSTWSEKLAISLGDKTDSHRIVQHLWTHGDAAMKALLEDTLKTVLASSKL